MHVYTQFGYAAIGALYGICWARPPGPHTYTCEEYPVHFLKRADGKIVGVCEKHRVELESKGWTYLGQSKRHPHIPFEEWDAMKEDEKKWLWEATRPIQT